MSTIQQTRIRNLLLRAMTPEDFGRMAPLLQPIDLSSRFVLSSADRLTDYTYFLESGIGSIVVEGSSGLAAEVCIVGSEGMVPTSAVLGASSLPFEIFMQVPGNGYRIENVQLIAAYNADISLRNILNRYIQAVSVQMAYTAFSNANHQIEQRLARWILMCHDRSHGDRIELTHEFLSVMLSVRRQSVTTTLHVLEGKHLVTSARGVVTMRDREGLEELAGDAYGIPEREYNSLIRLSR
jgi:CRP-like cAMP-binding protein